MALRNLTSWDDPLFDKKSRAVERFDGRLCSLLDDMLETLRAAGGYGCAAVHVGILRRALVVDDDGGVIELINPEIIGESAETQAVHEGSIAPGAPRGTVIRPTSVTVTGFDRRGESLTLNASGFLAATFCHEIDHMDGLRFTDRAEKPD